MGERIQIKAVDMVRRIRDEQAQILTGKSVSDIISYYSKASALHRSKNRFKNPLKIRRKAKKFNK